MSLQLTGADNMDILNAFFVFNTVATVATLAAFFAMRESVAEGLGAIKAKAGTLNFAGAAGAATSLVVLASVAHLFQ
jgi:hypothetical protein